MRAAFVLVLDAWLDFAWSSSFFERARSSLSQRSRVSMRRVLRSGSYVYNATKGERERGGNGFFGIARIAISSPRNFATFAPFQPTVWYEIHPSLA